jgi:hypothetical protein
MCHVSAGFQAANIEKVEKEKKLPRKAEQLSENSQSECNGPKTLCLSFTGFGTF